MRRAAILLAGALAAAPARAETLVATMSTERVSITSNFTGTEIAVFGEINRDGATVARAAGYDLVVTVRGPKGSVVVREKQPAALGVFWLNLDQRKYIAIPAFIQVLSNRPIDQIATAPMRARWHIGVDDLVPARGDRNEPGFAREPEFRAALVRLRREQKLFGENPGAVTFLGSNLFRAKLPLPGTVPLGRYEVDAALFVEGVRLATAATSFSVDKGGAEQSMAAAARDNALVYGIGTAIVALVAGWLASLIFRRD